MNKDRLILITNPGSSSRKYALYRGHDFLCSLHFEFEGKKVVAKSVLNVMSAGIKTGSEITLICNGEDEAQAMKAVSDAIKSGLGEN